jgi:PAS domain-containing protein
MRKAWSRYRTQPRTGQVFMGLARPSSVLKATINAYQRYAVTQSEVHFPSGTTLMSITNTQGNVTYANDACVAVSGYVREELEGQPHNLVRYPDMPS